MKLSNLKKQLKEKLLIENKRNLNRIKKEYKDRKKDNEEKEIKIIGITGSRGKTTTAYIVHEYLKQLGYKSVLYSSAKIDSPTTRINPNEACEVSFDSEESLLAILEEAESYNADYLVLEVNESTLARGIVKDIPFTVRALTNLNPTHNMEQYTKEEYVALKKSFFENISNEEKCTCVIGVQDYDKTLYEELLALNDKKKLTFTSNYIAKVKNLDLTKVDVLLEELESSLDGLKLRVKIGKKLYDFTTSLKGQYNALNLVDAITILKALEVFDNSKFNETVKTLLVPGRMEVYKENGRIVVIDPNLSSVLEFLKKLKQNHQINKIKVVVGSLGTGFKNWNDSFKTTRFLSSIKPMRQYAMELLKENVDFVYLTENDNAKEDVLEICLELQEYLEGKVPSKIVVDRSLAIKEALEEAGEGDVIFISGRGNRRILCNSESTMKLLKDSEIVEQVLKDLRW